MLITLTEIQVANIGVVPLPVWLYGARLRFFACSLLLFLSFTLFSKASPCDIKLATIPPVKKRSLCDLYAAKDVTL